MRFQGKRDDGLVNEERAYSHSISVCYDLTATSDLKFRYDITSDDSNAGIAASGAGRYGDSRMLAFSYDVVF